MTDKRKRETDRALRRLGFRLHRETGKHLIYRHPKGGSVTAAVSASDSHARKNLLADARRIVRQHKA